MEHPLLEVCADSLASFLTMGFVRHGDNRVAMRRGLEAYDIED